MNACIPDGFEQVRERRIVILVRSDARQWLLPLLRSAAGEGAPVAARPLVGGRGGAVRVRVNADEVVLRSCRRGGLPAWVLRQTYFGCAPRPFLEVGVLETLRRQGVPVVEAMGACVRWLAPGCYRGWVVTRYVSGAKSLWDWAAGPAEQWDRAGVWRAAGQAIRQLHDAGVRHPDLNLRNVLLCPGGDTPTVLLVDFDRPRFPVFRPAAADLRRLERSARKLDPQGQWVTPADLGALRAAYGEGAP